MHKSILALAVAASLTLAARPADAGCGSDCPDWLDVLGYGFAAALIGGYAAGTGYFIYRDVTDEQQSLSYGGTEAGVNALLAALFVGGTVDAVRHDSTGSAIVLGGLATVHTTLTVHGTWRMWQQRGELGHFNPPPHTLEWVGGIAYGLNTALWALQLPGQHGRNYGIAEAAVNAPIALGLGYLAIDRARDRDAGPAALFGGMAVVSGALAAHGVYRALHPSESPGLDLLGTDLVPTVVGDGQSLAPGLGAARTW